MIGYLEALDTLHTRGVNIDLNDYLFCLMVVNGDDTELAYAASYDTSEFKRKIGTDEEQEYFSSKKQLSEAQMSNQSIKMLCELMEEKRRAEIQKEALNLKDYKFSGEETVQILNNLLKTRIDDMESSSVKDVVSILKALTDQGALEVGDGGFQRHFVQIFPKFNALCVHCNREFEIAKGIGAICPHCGQEYHWSSEENRFYPQPTKL